jgi:hypothetical protein
MRRLLPLTLALAVLLPASVSATADDDLLTGGAVPRLEPFTARAVPCGDTSCLDIGWRVRGDIGPRLVWQLTVRDPGGEVVYNGAKGSVRERRVTGLLHPARPPRCGRYRVTLDIEDPDGDNFTRTRTVVRRHLCTS